MLKNLTALRELQVWFLGWEDALEKGMATHSSFLACRIPWTEEPGWLQSMGLQRIRHEWATNTFTFSLILVCFISIFTCLRYYFSYDFFFDPLVVQWCVVISTHMWVFQFSSLKNFSFIPLLGEMLDRISVFLNLLRLVLWPNISILESFKCTWEECVFCCFGMECSICIC